jgi:endonuclease YncB( thermonuclease family)
MARRVLLATVLAALLYASVSATDWIVSSVPTGETFVAVEHTVRIRGIDAPPAEESRRHLEELIGGRAVTVSGDEDFDQWGRWWVYITGPDNDDIGARMIREGYARADTRDRHERMDEYIDLEQQARRELRGLWSDPDALTFTDAILRDDPTSSTPELTYNKQVNPLITDPYFPVYPGDFLYHLKSCWLLPAEPAAMSYIQSSREDLLDEPIGFAVIEGFRACTHCVAPVLDSSQVDMDYLRTEWLQAFGSEM